MHDEFREAVQRAGMDLPTPHPDLKQVQRGGKRALVVRMTGAVVLGMAMLASLFALYPSLTSDRKSSEVSEGPSDPAVSLDPNRLSVGDQAELRVHSSAQGTYGLEWILERRQGSSWQWNGYLQAGPGKQWKERFGLLPLSEGGIEDIGFNGAAVMTIEIPKLEPGNYRLRTDFIRGGREPLEDRKEWYYVEFEVIE